MFVVPSLYLHQPQFTEKLILKRIFHFFSIISGSASAKTDHHNNLLEVPEHEATLTTDSAAAAASALVAAPRLGDLGRRFSLGMSMKAGFMSGKNNPPIGAGAGAGAGIAMNAGGYRTLERRWAASSKFRLQAAGAG